MNGQGMRVEDEPRAGAGLSDFPAARAPTRPWPQRLMRDERLRVLAVAALVGACCGGLASGFRWLIAVGFDLTMAVHASQRSWAVPLLIAMPAIGGLIVGALHLRWAQELRGQGFESILALTSGGSSNPRAAITKFASCAVTTASGGSAGCEGPIARVGAEFGTWLATYVRIRPGRVQVLAACGASASIAGLFDAPLAGVLFAAEVVLGGYAFTSFAPLLVASVASTAVVRQLTSRAPVFGELTFRITGAHELLIHAVLGCACGAFAALFIHLLERTERMRDRWPTSELLRPALGGLGVGVILLLVPHAMGVGYPSVQALLHGGLATSLAAALLAAKLVATVLTLGSGGSGGAFAPSLLMGGALGMLVGKLSGHLWPGSMASANNHALLGMAAMVAGVTHAPLTAIVLVFELSGSYRTIPSGAIACIVATLVSSTLRRQSVYGMSVDKRAAQHDEPPAVTPSDIRVADMIKTVRDVVPGHVTLGQLKRRPFVDRAMLVVHDDERFAGIIRDARLQDAAAPDDTQVIDLVESVPVLRPTDTLPTALGIFVRIEDIDAVPVVASDDRPLGWVLRDDVLRLSARDLLRNYLRLGEAEAHEGEPLRAQSHEVCAVPVPRGFVGRTLEEIDLGRSFGVGCIGLRRATEAGSFVALPVDPRLPLHAEDVLILSGEGSKLDRVRRLDIGRQTGTIG